jgi:hypothetical protein
VPHRGEHAHPEHVELQQPQRGDVVLVELADRIAVRAALHGRTVEQRVVTEQDPARMHREVARHAVDTRDEVEQRPEPPGIEPAAGELREPLERTT